MEAKSTSPQPIPQANLGNWISRGWALVTEDFGTHLLLGLIYIAIISVASATAIGVFIVIGPLNVGFFIIFFEKLRGRPINIGDIGKGFNFFVAAVLSNIIIGVFASIGYILCIIPGIIIQALYLFVPAFIAEKNLDFWGAMEASRNVIKKYVFEISIFIILQGIFLILGFLFCCVGLLFAIPLCFAMTAAAYEDLVGLEKKK